MKGDEHDDEHLSSFRKRKKLKKIVTTLTLLQPYHSHYN